MLIEQRWFGNHNILISNAKDSTIQPQFYYIFCVSMVFMLNQKYIKIILES